MTFCADWLVACGWPDPMADVRGLYDDRLSCERATGFIRAPVETVSRRADAIGLPRGNDLRSGDVAVIRIGGASVGAIWTGMGWAAKGEAGTATVLPALVEVLAFWSVGYRA